MRSPLDSFASQMIFLNIERNGSHLSNVKGLKNNKRGTGKKMFQFYPDVDIEKGDWIIEPTTNTRYYVIDVEPVFFSGNLVMLNAFYLTSTEYEHETSNGIAQTIFNISNPQGSIIGNQATATLNLSYNDCLQELKETIESSNSSDKEDLAKIVLLLELALDDKIPVKKGLLSKFSDVISKHSWLASQLSALLINWLTSQ